MFFRRSSELMQGFLELWGEGETWEELEASIAAFPDELKQPWLQSNLSMKVGCHSDTLSEHLSMEMSDFDCKFEGHMRENVCHRW